MAGSIIVDNINGYNISVGQVLCSNGQSFASNGYQKLSNGLIIQWGQIVNSNSNSFTFPIAFPSYCASVQVIGTDNLGHHVATKTTTGWTGDPQVGGSTKNAHWIAIGY